MRASRAYTGHSAEEQLIVLESNPCFQDLRRRQRCQKRQRRGYQRARQQPCAEQTTPEHRCTYWWCGDSFDDRASLTTHMQMHDDDSDDPSEGQVRESLDRCSSSDVLSNISRYCYDDIASTTIFDRMIRDLRHDASFKDVVCGVCSSSDEYSSGSVSDAPVYQCGMYRCGESFTDRVEFSKHIELHDDQTSHEPLKNNAIVADSSSDEERYGPVVDTRSLTERARDIRRQNDARDAGIIPEKCFPCPHGWCGTLFPSTDALRNHVATSHMREGFISRLQHESHVLRELRGWGLTVATSVEMYVSRHGWVSDTTREFARVDMVVMDVTSCILLLEVDENAHQDSRHPVVCELSRQADVNTYLRLKGYTQPIDWLRFNPNGPYFVGDKERFRSREAR